MLCRQGRNDTKGPAVFFFSESLAAKVKLCDALVQNLAVGKVYRDHKGPVTGMDFTYDGQFLVTSGEETSSD